MATNPMQRKARNSFLLGMLVMLLISGIVIAFLVMQLMSKIKEEKECSKSMVNVCVLKQDVTSGQIITSEMIETKAVRSDLIPANATSVATLYDNFFYTDEEGNEIVTEVNNGEETLKIIINNEKIDSKSR